MSDKSPSELIIPSGFSSSDRVLAQIAETEDTKKREAEEQLEEERLVALDDLKFRKESSRTKALDKALKTNRQKSEAKPKVRDTRTASGAVDTVSTFSSSTLPENPTTIDATPIVSSIVPSRKPSRLAKSIVSLGRGADSTATRINKIRKATARKTTAGLVGAKRAATSEATKQSLRRAGATAARSAKVSRGVALVGAQRFEQRVFDRNGRAFFRPLEISERRRLGLPTGEAFTTEELRQLSIGLTPPSLLRQRRVELNAIDDNIIQLRRQILDRSAVNEELTRLAELRRVTTDPAQLEELRTRSRELNNRLIDIQNIDSAIQGLEKRKQIILTQQSNVSDAVRGRAFVAALQRSPSFNPNPIGQLTPQTKRRGRPRKPNISRPELDVILR